MQIVLGEQLKALKDMYKYQKINTNDYQNAVRAAGLKKIDVDYEEGDLIMRGASLQEELFDSITCVPDHARDALVFELYRKARLSGVDKFKSSFKILGDRDKFKSLKEVHDFYKSSRTIINTAGDTIQQKYCVVTGRRYTPVEDYVNVIAAHIVPYSFRGSALNYLFGEPEENLTIGRNGLPLREEIEYAFDSQQITIVPLSEDQPEDEPSEWKLVILKKNLMDKKMPINSDLNAPDIFWKVCPTSSGHKLFGHRSTTAFKELKCSHSV